VLSGIIEVPECNLEFWQNRTQTDNVAAWLDEKVIYESGWSLPVGVNKEDSHGDAPVTAYASYCRYSKETGTQPKSCKNFSPQVEEICKTVRAGLLSANIPCPVIALPISGSELTKISTPTLNSSFEKTQIHEGSYEGSYEGSKPASHKDNEGYGLCLLKRIERKESLHAATTALGGRGRGRNNNDYTGGMKAIILHILHLPLWVRILTLHDPSYDPSSMQANNQRRLCRGRVFSGG